MNKELVFPSKNGKLYRDKSSATSADKDYDIMVERYKDNLNIALLNAMTCICRSNKFIITPEGEYNITCRDCGRLWNILLLKDKYIKESLVPEFVQYDEYTYTNSRGIPSFDREAEASVNRMHIKYGIV